MEAPADMSAKATISTAPMRRNAGHFLRAGGRLRAQERHHLAGEEADGLQAFRTRQVAEGELADHVVATGFGKLRVEELSHRCRRAGDALAALDQQIEGRGTGMRLRPAMPAEQMREACVPDEVGAARQRQRRSVARRNDDEAAQAELGERGRANVNLRPDGAIAIDGALGFVRRVETDHVEIAARGALSALRRVYAIPDGGMRFLQRLDFHRHAAEGKSPALEVEHLAGQPLEHELDRLRVDLLRVLRIDAVIFELDRRGAAPEAEFEAP